MKNITFRNLTKDEIEVRVGGGSSLLLYKTARVDANILDETVGQSNWQKKFYQVKNTMICSLGININYDDPTKEPYWVWKDDAGDDDYTMEKVKAEASDSFKRAGFAWGIGRCLYYGPKMKLPEEFKSKQFFDVSELEYDKENHISKITITCDWGKTIVYQYPKGKNTSQTTQNSGFKTNDIKVADTFLNHEKGSITNEQKQMIETYVSGLRYTDRFFQKLDETYGVGSIEFLSEQQAQEIISKIGGK